MTNVMTEAELQSDHAELGLLGSALRHPDAIAGVLASLPGADFYRLARGIVWDACRALSAANEPINPVTIGRWLQARGQWSRHGDAGNTQHVVQVEMVADSTASAAYARKHADLVAEFARRRELVRAITHVRQLAAECPGDASEALAAVRAHLNTLETGAERDTGTRTWAQMFEEFEAAHTVAPPVAIPTPWQELDDVIGGLYGGRLYVIGGAPGDGKSVAAFNIALHAALLGHEVLAFSAEMPRLDVFGRMVSRPAEVELHTINRHRVTEVEMSRIRDYVKAHYDLPLRVNAENMSLSGISSMARAHHHRRGLGVLVVDYLQLVNPDSTGRSTEEEIAKISTALKRLARELDCAVVVPAQLNRNHTARANSRPTKADLRGSGKIEQDSDVVILLWHEEVDGKRTDDVTFILDKNRHGPRDVVRLPWVGEYGSIG